MMALPMTLLSVDRLRRPEYTGPNRCRACTAVNLVLTAVSTVVVALVWLPLGFVVAAVGLSSIYLRGYLVPGTPELTKRYLPTPILRWFAKAEDATIATEPSYDDDDTAQTTDPETTDTVTDPETFLREANALTDCPDDDDLCLPESFADEWRREMRRIRDDDATRAALATVIDAAPEDISFSYAGDTSRVFAHLGDDERFVGQWVSSAALRADVASAAILSDEESWTAMNGRDRAATLASLRVFVPSCPDCVGPVAFHEDETGGCCWSTPVVLLHCEDCEVPLLRLDQSTVTVVS